MIDITMTFRLFLLPNFAANQLVIIMEIITFESKAYKELDNKITAIADYIFRGRYFYKVSEIRRMLEERLIRSNKENIDNLITNHQLYAKERGNLRKNK